MSQFYGKVTGSAKTIATRGGSKSSGLAVRGDSWDGGGEISMWHEAGRDYIRIALTKGSGQGSGGEIELYSGPCDTLGRQMFLDGRLNRIAEKLEEKDKIAAIMTDAQRALLKEEIANLKRLLGKCFEELKISLEEVGGCDHSAGICSCELEQLIANVATAIGQGGAR